MNKRLFLILAGLLSLIGCKSETTAVWEWNLPEHFPIPSVPEDNPMSQVKETWAGSYFTTRGYR